MLGKQEVSNRRLHSGTEPWLLSLGWVECESEAWSEVGRSQSILTIETVVYRGYTNKTADGGIK
eukprot:scaffold71234_cov82-Cyclotella_meneghiniana.AAC.6